MSRLRAGIGRRMLPASGGIAAALAVCLAIPEALGALGCQELGIFGSCVGASPTAFPGIQTGILLTLTVLAASFVGIIVYEGTRHSRLARAFSSLAQPASVMGQRVGVVPGINGAVVAGVARPAIYCSEDLMGALEDEELAAVLLHERHHQRTRAPLRLVILAAAGRFIDWSAVGRRWLDRRRAAIEIAADAYVISTGLPRPVLARAILKLHDAHSEVPAAGFGGAVDLRLRALVGNEAAEDRPLMPPIAAVTSFLIACIALL